MSLARIALTLAAAAYTAHLVMKARRLDASPTAPGAGSSLAGLGGDGPARAAGAGARNTGEQLQDRGLAAPADSDPMFGSSSQRGPSAQSPGLGDFSRGA